MDARLTPDGLSAELARYSSHALAMDQSPRTVSGRESSLRSFILWCQERAIAEPVDVTRPVLERYRRYLFHFRQNNGKPLSVNSQRNRLTHIKMFFRYLAREGRILHNPAAEFDLPKTHRRLPKAILTVQEVEAVCAQCLLHGDWGIRDRAMIETFYATGIRRQELGVLDVYDVDLEQGTLMVRQGKGKKDRLLPIGERACWWIEKYTTEVRPALVTGEELALFLDDRGRRFSPHQLSDKVKTYLAEAGITKPGACHLFRHTMATLMLENGADIRFIQAMLGHADISTTTIYTQVSIRALKEVYSRTHPAKHAPRSQAQPAAEPMPTAEDLLEALEREAVEEAGV